MEESHDLLKASNALKKSDFESIRHTLLNNAPDFVAMTRNTERNTAFADQTNPLPELTYVSAPALYSKPNFEYERYLGDGSSTNGALFNHGACTMQNALTTTYPGRPQFCGIGAKSTRKYHNIEPCPTGRSLQVLKDKPRKRSRDPTRAFAPGRNPYGRRGTVKCQLCRSSRLKVDLHGRNLIVVCFYS